MSARQEPHCSFFQLRSVPSTLVPTDRPLAHFQSPAVTTSATGHHLVHLSSCPCRYLQAQFPRWNCCHRGSVYIILTDIAKLLSRGLVLPGSLEWGCGEENTCVLLEHGVLVPMHVCFWLLQNGSSHVLFCVVHFAVTYLGDILDP